jgi:hypothetical protein
MLYWAPRREEVWGSGDTAPRMSNFDIKWSSIVSFKFYPHYLWYPLKWRQGGPRVGPKYRQSNEESIDQSTIMSDDIKIQLTRPLLEVWRVNEYGEAMFIRSVGYFISDVSERWNVALGCLYQSCVNLLLWTMRARVRVRVTLRLAVYRQSIWLGDKLLETHDQ